MNLILQAIKSLFRGIKSRLSKVEEVTKTIDNKLDAPKNAEVGQILMVSAVDENGKPTILEPIDIPSNDETYDMIIRGVKSEKVIEKGSYESVKAKILAKEQVSVKLYNIRGNNRFYYPVLRVLFDEEDNELEITYLDYTGAIDGMIVK